ncbi:MAG: hypothetical protein V3R89_01825 [Thermoanaerobaculia bacterium]
MKPLIFIPGLPGSDLFDTWDDRQIFFKPRALLPPRRQRTLGYRPFTDDFRPLGWDWRKPVYHRPTLTFIEHTIRDLHQKHGQRVVALVHSTGGLVLRALVESKPEVTDLLERIIAFGVPWAGTLMSLRMLSAKEGFGPFLSARRAQPCSCRRAWNSCRRGWSVAPTLRSARSPPPPRRRPWGGSRTRGAGNRAPECRGR